MRKVVRKTVVTRYRETEIEDLNNKILIDKIYCLKNILSADSVLEGLSEARRPIISEENREFLELKLMSLIQKLC